MTSRRIASSSWRGGGVRPAAAAAALGHRGGHPRPGRKPARPPASLSSRRRADGDARWRARDSTGTRSGRGSPVTCCCPGSEAYVWARRPFIPCFGGDTSFGRGCDSNRGARRLVRRGLRLRRDSSDAGLAGGRRGGSSRAQAGRALLLRGSCEPAPPLDAAVHRRGLASAEPSVLAGRLPR